MTNDNNKNNGIKIASPYRRIFSFIIDEMIMSLLFVAMYSNILLYAKSEDEMILIVQSQIWKYYAVKVIYHTLFNWYFGQTVGKYICKIKCVDFAMNKLTISKSFFRALIRIASEYVLYVGFLIAFFTPLRQTLHDKLSNSLVIDAK